MKLYKQFFKALTAVLLFIFMQGYQQAAAVPSSLIMQRGETHSLPPYLSAYAPKDSFLFKNNQVIPTQSGTFAMHFSLLGLFPKTTDVQVVEPATVTLGGETVGIKLFLDGVLVVGISEIPGSERKSPGRDAGIQVGDRILRAGGQTLRDSDMLNSIVESSEGKPITLSVCRGEEEWDTVVTPVYYAEGGAYKLGLWVRESTAGIGTVTFSLPEKNVYAALGHGIEDPDAGTMLAVAKGSITDCDIAQIIPGEQGSPGELRGVFHAKDIGTVDKNISVGIYGHLQHSLGDTVRVPIAVSTQVKSGAAQIFCEVDGAVRGYNAEIEKLLPYSTNSTKSMILHVTDEQLLAQTGGIVQGMSGSPIVQDGRLVGAVTHVFVNDPTRGYGIFAETMLDALREAA